VNTAREHLAALAAALPPDGVATVPVAWLRELLSAAPAADALVADLTVDQLAQFFGKRPGTIRGWVEEGRFQGAYKLRGKAWRVPHAAVEAFQAREREGKPLEGSAAPDRRAGGLAAWRDVRRGTA
jgi:excisionase family DNA binding protein